MCGEHRIALMPDKKSARSMQRSQLAIKWQCD